MYVQRFGSQLQLPFSSEKRKQQPSPAGVKNGIMLHSVAKTALLGIFSIISFLPSIWLSTDQRSVLRAPCIPQQAQSTKQLDGSGTSPLTAGIQ